MRWRASNLNIGAIDVLASGFGLDPVNPGGTTNTNVIHFNAANMTLAPSVTHVATAADGSSFNILESGMYWVAMTYSSAQFFNEAFGVSQDGAAAVLTGNPTPNLALGMILAEGNSNSSGQSANMVKSAGAPIRSLGGPVGASVIRFHATDIATAVTPLVIPVDAACTFRIIKLGELS